jgi:hypothetical protein
MELMGHFGIGAIVIGVLGILLESSHWLAYFKERLSDIVIDKSYLNDLSPQSLAALQTDVLKAFYKDSQMDGEHGFLRYYQDQIQKFIVAPYRSNFSTVLKIDYKADDRTKFVVSEKTSWQCVSNGKGIQEEIIWAPNDGEFDSAEVKTITLNHSTISQNEMTEMVYGMDKFEPAWKQGQGICMPMPEPCRGLNNLYISVEAEYTINTTRFIGTSMAHMSKGFGCTLSYPQDCAVVNEIYGMDKNWTKFDKDGLFQISCIDWLLPGEGLVIQLLPKIEAVKTHI